MDNYRTEKTEIPDWMCRQEEYNPLQTKKLFLPEAQNLFCLCWQDSDLMKGRMADFLPLLLLNCFIRYFILFLPHVREIICLY